MTSPWPHQFLYVSDMPEISSIAFKIATTEVLHQYHDTVANIICCLNLNPEITKKDMIFLNQISSRDERIWFYSFGNFWKVFFFFFKYSPFSDTDFVR